jgi:hypothetical protein
VKHELIIFQQAPTSRINEHADVVCANVWRVNEKAMEVQLEAPANQAGVVRKGR